MAVFSQTSWAKVNLTLDVLRRRPDGYHDLQMIMQTISLSDEITLTLTDGPGLSLTSNLPYLPTDERNLALAAAKVFFRKWGKVPGGMRFHIEKRIPVCAGMGGGSSNAAAVLTLLSRIYEEPFSGEELLDMAMGLGSDVPFFLKGGTQLAEGRGERLTPLPPLPPCTIVVCKPHCSASTAQIFAAFDGSRSTKRPDTAGALRALETGNLQGVARRLYNQLEPFCHAGARERADMVKIFMDTGALGTCMTGSGPTQFALYAEEGPARAACRLLSDRWKETFLLAPV